MRRTWKADCNPPSSQSRSQSFVPLDQRLEKESSGSNHFRHAPWHAIDAVWDCALNRTTSIFVARAHDHSDLRQGSRAPAGRRPDPNFLSMRGVFVSYPQPIRFARFDGESVNRGLPELDDVLDKARALDPCRRSEWLWALGTRMDNQNRLFPIVISKRMLPELSCSDRWLRGTKLWDCCRPVATPHALLWRSEYNVVIPCKVLGSFLWFAVFFFRHIKKYFSVVNC